MPQYVLGFQDPDAKQVALVGGKGANLGELTALSGVHVPEGFCVTVDAYKATVDAIPGFADMLRELRDSEDIAKISRNIRASIEAAPIAEEIAAAVTVHLQHLGADNAYAVRSSATAEDLPGASFAGQQDTYLNILGIDAVLVHMRKCWASLFTERAVLYRRQNGFDHSAVFLAVVIQKMIFPEVSGIMFTADPVTSNRKIISIDASFGLGEALVSGLVNPDTYAVREGHIGKKTISAKRRGIFALPAGGTEEREVDGALQNMQALRDTQILELAALGSRIETYFGRPQDIEWCLARDTLYIVQSRPITTLFGVPEVTDKQPHVYLSVAHQQMMTDAMRPLGLSLWQMTAARPMFKASGRLFVDIAQQLAVPASRDALLRMMSQHDPLTFDAVSSLIARGDMIPAAPDTPPAAPKAMPSLHPADPSLAPELIRRDQESLEALQRSIATKTGPELLDVVFADIQELKKSLFNPQSTAIIIAGANTTTWLNEHMQEWLGERNAADVLSQSAPDNLTSEMGLALLDVADAVRPYPAVIAYLEHGTAAGFLEGLAGVEGGEKARDAIRNFLQIYGVRCAGEIDITNDRWAENPSILAPMILANVRNCEPGASRKRFTQGLQEAAAKEQELLARLKQLPEGEEKARETKEKTDLMRASIGYREYPKYGIMCRYFAYKQALLAEGARLVAAGVLHQIDDMYYLAFNELQEVVRTRAADHALIARRREEFVFDQKLTPPRVMTSDGEIITGTYTTAVPKGALPGLAVSAGVVEGRARVVMHLQDAVLEEGDILVTSFTDPSWTPLFVSLGGLVTEVGGLMTHGAVIAREYGLPAVVGVENATKLIKDGQRIRVHGAEGYVEIL